MRKTLMAESANSGNSQLNIESNSKTMDIRESSKECNIINLYYIVRNYYITLQFILHVYVYIAYMYIIIIFYYKPISLYPKYMRIYI